MLRRHLVLYGRNLSFGGRRDEAAHSLALGIKKRQDGRFISIGWVAAPAGMSIDDFEVVEFLRHAKEEGEEHDVETSKGTKSAHTLGTTMRTDFRGKVDTSVIPGHGIWQAADG